MYENRQSKRLVQQNELTIKAISNEELSLNRKIIYHMSKDISSTGARIQTNAFLPVDTLLKIQLTLKDPPRIVTALGKVKWVRSLYSDESFEAGLEFVDTSEETVKLLADHVAEATGQ